MMHYIVRSEINQFYFLRKKLMFDTVLASQMVSSDEGNLLRFLDLHSFTSRILLSTFSDWIELIFGFKYAELFLCKEVGIISSQSFQFT